MNVLVLHSRYLSGTASGENRVVETEVALLRQAGHAVDVWEPSVGDGLRGRARAGTDTVWATGAARRVRRLVSQRGVEVVHCHNLFPNLSPAVVRAAADAGAAVVMTLHNYRLLCLPATFLRRGAVCEACLGRPPWRGVVHRCYRGSWTASAALATSLQLHRLVSTFDCVAVFLAVSEFVRRKHVAAGLDAGRITVKPNAVLPAVERKGPGEYFLVLGRLSAEKGVRTVLEAHEARHGPLLVAGDGPERTDLERFAGARGQISFLGDTPRSDVAPLLSRARALLVPSRSYEGAPLVIAEAFAAGVPVLASDLGGAAEAVQPEVNGRVLPPADVAAWRAAMTELLDDRVSERLGAGALATWRVRHAPEPVLRQLEAAYTAALQRRRHV